jgi:hypothetical protein
VRMQRKMMEITLVCAREMDAKRRKESTIRNEGLNCAFVSGGGCVVMQLEIRAAVE